MKIIILLILFSSYLTHSQWVRVSNGIGNNISVSSITSIGNNIFAGTRNSGVFLSTNSGLNWTQTSLGGNWITSFVVIGNTLYAGSLGIYSTTNNGANWNFSNLYNRAVYSMAISGNSIYGGTTDYNNNPYGVYTSRDNGSNWSQTALTNRIVYSLVTDSNNIFAGTGDPGYGVYKSTNSGKVWSQTSLNNRDIRSLAVKGNYVFAGTYDNSGSNPHGLYLSTDKGSSWSQSSLNNVNIYALAVKDNYIFAGGDHGSIFYVSGDNGANWSPWNTGINSNPVLSICVINNYIYAGTFNNGIYRRPLSDLVGIQSISSLVPNQFSLSQNYPNPFNPTTKIRFEISGTSAEQTFLYVYDITGREIAILVNQELKPGTYEAEWNASNFPSGVYFYKLSAGSFSETKKMVLIK